MKRIVAVSLFALFFLLPGLIPYTANPTSANSSANISYDPEKAEINLHALAELFGNDIPVVVRFAETVDPDLIYDIQSMGIEFAFDNPETSHIEKYYLLRGTETELQSLLDLGMVESIAPQTPSDNLRLPRDVSVPEINADVAWNMLDSLGRNLTGKGILVADLDSGVDWNHPDLWFPGEVNYSWIDVQLDAAPDNGTDAVDLDNDTVADPNESLFFIDVDKDGTFNATTDWLWVDNITQDGVPQIGEPFFVVRDENGNDKLDPDEKLVMLVTPKTKYIVEKDGTPSANIQVWERGVNLTASTHKDTDGHGTAVAGILLGGQLGFRKYVGVAPNAELMMIKVLGTGNTWLTVEEGLTWAYHHGADVILTEIGSWTYHYLDGSSSTELLVNTIVSNGIPVISPSGNLGFKDKHALFKTSTNSPFQVDFTIPQPDGANFSYPIENVYITVLSINATDFWSCNFSLIMNLAVWGGPPAVPIYLHPGSGYLNFKAEPAVGWGGNSFTVDSFISTSTRSTQMLGIWIHGTLPTTNAPPWHQFNATTPFNTTFHGYISDDQTSWTGGVTWKSSISNAYEITWPSTADSALSVASYRTRNLLQGNPPSVLSDIASFSSRGPRVDESLKQGVAAPGGYDIISDYSNESVWQAWFNAYGNLPFNAAFGGYRLFSGTSASGPHVAGCAALLLQYNPSVGSSVKDIIQNTARTDTFTGTVPNAIWGYGKLDVKAALNSIDGIPPVIHSVQRTPQTVEYDDSIVFEVNVTDNQVIDGVFVKYAIDSWTSPTFTSMSLQPTGNYMATIGPFPYGHTIFYTILANDSAGNTNETTVVSFAIGDFTSPFLTNFARNATTPGENRDVLVYVDVLEPVGSSGVDKVLLNWSASPSVWHIVVMSPLGLIYYGVIPGQPIGTTVQYRITANDTAGNTNTSQLFSYTTVAADFEPPRIEGITIQTGYDTQHSARVLTNVTDNTAVDTIILSYFNGTHWNNITMDVTLSDSIYIGEAFIPLLPVGTNVTVRIYTSDLQGNWAVSEDQWFIVSETPTPTTPPQTGTTNTETTSTSTTPLPTEPNLLLLAVMLAIILALIIISIIISRRRSL